MPKNLADHAREGGTSTFAHGDRVRIRTGFFAGRTGTVQGHGIINKPGHPNHGLPTVKLTLDPTSGSALRLRGQQLTNNLELLSR